MPTAATADEVQDEKEKKKHPRDPAREVVETVVFVVVLVLLLKLFVTEAFVIPTGSMAETLYGYQTIVRCAKCGHEFPVNAHDQVEVNQQTQQKHILIEYCCPNCRYLGEISGLNPVPQPRTGDRVLVLKPLYHLRDPHRGDVVVFKFPEEPQKNHIAANYIKRAMGFGGETIAIHRGELFVTTSLTYPEDSPLYPRPDDPLNLWESRYMYRNSAQGEALFEASRAAGFTDRVPGGFQIIRKGEQQVLADRRIVWDNDKQPKDLVGVVPPRWAPRGSESKWNADDPKQPRAFGHTGGELDWIRYQHYVWKNDGSGRFMRDPRDPHDRPMVWRWPEDANSKPLPGPIDNMLGYNAGTDQTPAGKKERRDDPNRGPEPTMWVGDLILECEVDLTAGSEVVLELSKGANQFQAKFGKGEVLLARVGAKGPEFGNPKRPCKVNGGVYKLRFANVDHRLWVWVDDKRIDFGTEGDYSPAEPTVYDPEDKQKEGWVRTHDIDAPASIGALGPVPAIRNIKLFRDVYYTRSASSDYTTADIFYVQPGHYMCLGDNSAQSSDSRKWGTVPERLMLGKAVFVFWPGWPKPSRIGFIK